MTNLNAIKSILTFMQSEDRNGSWLEWYEEIKRNESDFDKDYIVATLNEWHNDTNEAIYLTKINQVKEQI